MISDFRIENYGILKSITTIAPENEGFTQYKYGFSLENHINHEYLDDRLIGRIYTKVNYTVDAGDEREEDPQDSQNEDESDPLNYATIELDVVSIFTISADIPFEEFKKMLQLNGMATAIPLIRSTIFTLANVLAIRCDVLLPNINVREIPWKDD